MAIDDDNNDDDLMDIDDNNDDDDLMVLGEIKNRTRKRGKTFEGVGHNGAVVVPSGLIITDEPENETLRKLRSFKQFDTVTDTSDHYFVKNNSFMGKVSLFFSKSWAKKIQEEWRILEKHLPGEFSIPDTK
jgi:hypothetical protein